MKKTFYLGLSFLVILSSLTLWKYFRVRERKNLIRKAEKITFVRSLLSDFEKRWTRGDLESDWSHLRLKCSEDLGDFISVDDDFTRCNPDYINCLIRNNVLFLGKDQISWELLDKKNGKYYRPVNPALLLSLESLPRFSYLFVLKYDHENFPIILEDNCHEAYLPQRIYSFGLENGDPFFRWDNFQRNLFIDKYLVSNRDLLEWIRETNQDIKIEGRPYEIALGLSPEKMGQFCQFRGKQLLTAHVHEASTLHPGDYANSRPLKSLYYPFPDGKLSKISKMLNEDEINLEKTCSWIYSAECRDKFSFTHFSNKNPSWIGLFQIMGGAIEYVQNPLLPNQSLVSTSYYFPLVSTWQQLGKRLFWEGQSFQRNRLKDIEEQDLTFLQENFDVGFRCMREVGQ